MSPPASTPPAGLAIRPAVPTDLERITDIYRHHVLTGTATFELVPPAAEEMAGRLAAVRGKGFPWLTAEIDGHVVGYAYAAMFRPRPAYAWTVEDSIYLDPAATGRGIGRRLLVELIRQCEALGLRRMIAVIGDSANTASIALHRSLGFEDAGVQRAVGLKFGRWLDTVMMQRDLGEGASSIPSSPPCRLPDSS